MKVERCTNDSNQFWVVEILDRKISRFGTAKVLAKLQGVEITHFPHWSDFDVFCTFTFQGHTFEVYEMYGDTGQYEISADRPDLEQLEVIARHFENSEPIKGGDLKHNIYALFNGAIRGSIILGIGFSIWAAYEWLSS